MGCWMMHKFCRDSNEFEVIKKISNICIAFATAGFVVTPVCDREIRHHSKRASVERRSDRERSRAKCFVS